MPLTACPECRHTAAVRDEQIGHRTRCPNCEHTFRAERIPISLHRIFRAGHAAGATVGALLLLAGLGVAGAIFGSGMDLTFSPRLALNVSAVAFVVGALIIIRHIRALASKPQPVSGRPLSTPSPRLPAGPKQA